MKKNTLAALAAAVAVGAAGWYLAAGSRKKAVDHIRREAKRLLTVRADELAALPMPTAVKAARRFAADTLTRANA